jgi:hypothetical protein
MKVETTGWRVRWAHEGPSDWYESSFDGGPWERVPAEVVKNLRASSPVVYVERTRELQNESKHQKF